MSPLKTPVATTLAAVTLALATAPAFGATYTQYACHLPDGTPAPVDGFSPSGDGGGTATNSCASGGGLTIDLPMTSAAGTRISAGWLYSPPPDESIVRFDYHRTISNIGAADDSTTRRWAGPSDSCGPAVLCADSATIDSTTSAPLFELFQAQCNESDACHGPMAGDGIVSIDSAAISIEDSNAPTFVRQPDGDLLAPGPVSGIRKVAFSATDHGGGVYQVALVLDGSEGPKAIVDLNGGRCREPFVTQVPCPGTADGALQVDTTKLANGTHTVAVVVYDATGVNSIASTPVAIDVHNDPASTSEAPHSTPASPTDGIGASDTGRRVVLEGRAVSGKLIGRVGRRATLRGRLVTLDGSPVGATVVEALSVITGRRLAHAITDSGGHFELVFANPLSTKMLVRAAESPPAIVRLVVRAPITLLASRRHLRNGQTLVLSARTHARGQARVAFQVLIGKAWRTFAVKRLHDNGRARVAHRFRLTYTRLTYRFRALLIPGARFPYAGARSSAVSVVVN